MRCTVCLGGCCRRALEADDVLQHTLLLLQALLLFTRARA